MSRPTLRYQKDQTGPPALRPRFVSKAVGFGVGSGFLAQHGGTGWSATRCVPAILCVVVRSTVPWYLRPKHATARQVSMPLRPWLAVAAAATNESLPTVGDMGMCGLQNSWLP